MPRRPGACAPVPAPPLSAITHRAHHAHDYVVAVVVIILLHPKAPTADRTTWLANLTLTQIYVPLTLTAGLTQMWSLSVEVSSCLALPVLALLGEAVAGAGPRSA